MTTTTKSYLKMGIFIAYTIVVILVIKLLYPVMDDQAWVIFQTCSTIAGILCVFLVAKKDIRNYYVGIIAVATYGTVAFHAGYVYDYLLNIYFLIPVQLIGWYMWSHHTTKESENEVEPAKIKHKWIIATGTLIMILLLSTVLYDAVSVGLKGIPSHLPYPLRFLDASTTVLTIVAQIFMMLRYKEQWILWIVINVGSIIMWIYLGYPITMVMWIIYLLNSIYGYYVWNKSTKKL